MFSRPWVKPDNPDKSKITWIRQYTSGRGSNAYWTVVQYFSVALAAANVLENTIRLGNQTIISWKCNMTYLELAWALLAPVPPLVALARYLGPFSKKPKEDNVQRKPPQGRATETNGASDVKDTLETMDASVGDRVDFCEGLLDSFANICGLVHVVFGTIVLSSVQFIGTLDALVVVGRFTASVLIVQLITMTQLYGKSNLPLPKPGSFQQLNRTNFEGKVYGMDLENGL